MRNLTIDAHGQTQIFNFTLLRIDLRLISLLPAVCSL
jgi:hypothetical protein